MLTEIKTRFIMPQMWGVCSAGGVVVSVGTKALVITEGKIDDTNYRQSKTCSQEVENRKIAHFSPLLNELFSSRRTE